MDPSGGNRGPLGQPLKKQLVFYADNEIGNFTMRGGPGVPGDWFGGEGRRGEF